MKIFSKKNKIVYMNWIHTLDTHLGYTQLDTHLPIFWIYSVLDKVIITIVVVIVVVVVHDDVAVVSIVKYS